MDASMPRTPKGPKTTQPPQSAPKAIGSIGAFNQIVNLLSPFDKELQGRVLKAVAVLFDVHL